MFMRASYKFCIFTYKKCYFFQYHFVGTSDILSVQNNDTACRLTCTDKFPNVPTKLRKSIIGGGGAGAPPPPPPSGNDSDIDIALFMTSYIDQETRNLRTF